ncbi:MAG: DUF2062 domain-containing protein [Rhodocyclaceae bacterium]|nr:DUF2062 domain-containing protein [Rhodocyclaceae bacterium]MDP1957087.1 DUF2062 domain-containing protein [Rhodocyclaceae bacterium]
MSLLERLQRHIPTREQLADKRWLRWLGPVLLEPRLWHWSRRGVALGVGIGVFFGLLIPIIQIPFSAVAAVVLRANVPAAAASTLITNPVTFGPIYYAAYQLGAWVTGEDAPAEARTPLPQQTGADESFWESLANVGLPLFVGLSISATIAGVSSYALISFGWYWRVMRRRRRRLTQK